MFSWITDKLNEEHFSLNITMESDWQSCSPTFLKWGQNLGFAYRLRFVIIIIKRRKIIIIITIIILLIIIIIT